MKINNGKGNQHYNPFIQYQSMCCILRVEDNAFSLFDLYRHTLAKNPWSGGHEIYKFAKTFLGHC